MHILFVSGETTERQTFSFLAQGAGLSCTAVEDAESALAALDEEVFNAVVTEVDLVETDGIELAAMLRKKSPGLSVVAYTHENQRHPVNVLEEIFDSVFLRPRDTSRIFGYLLKNIGREIDGEVG